MLPNNSRTFYMMRSSQIERAGDREGQLEALVAETEGDARQSGGGCLTCWWNALDVGDVENTRPPDNSNEARRAPALRSAFLRGRTNSMLLYVHHGSIKPWSQRSRRGAPMQCSWWDDYMLFVIVARILEDAVLCSYPRQQRPSGSDCCVPDAGHASSSWTSMPR